MDFPRNLIHIPENVVPKFLRSKAILETDVKHRLWLNEDIAKYSSYKFPEEHQNDIDEGKIIMLKTPQLNHTITIKHEKCRVYEQGGNMYYFRSHSDWAEKARDNNFVPG